MSKMARVMLESMGRFVLEQRNGNGNGRGNGGGNGHAALTGARGSQYEPETVGSYN